MFESCYRELLQTSPGDHQVQHQKPTFNSRIDRGNNTEYIDMHEYGNCIEFSADHKCIVKHGYDNIIHNEKENIGETLDNPERKPTTNKF